jgi:hypothetical protein
MENWNIGLGVMKAFSPQIARIKCLCEPVCVRGEFNKLLRKSKWRI